MTNWRMGITSIWLDGGEVQLVSGEFAGGRNQHGIASWQVSLIIEGAADPPWAPHVRAVLADGRAVAGTAVRRNSQISAGQHGVATSVLLLGNGPLDGVDL